VPLITLRGVPRAGQAVALALLLAVVPAAPGRPAVAEDNYPSRPVKIIAPQAPGGGVDLVARIIADRLRVAMGQSFVIENQAGAGGAIATQMTARAQPDGYTLMIGYVATHAIRRPRIVNRTPIDGRTDRRGEPWIAQPHDRCDFRQMAGGPVRIPLNRYRPRDGQIAPNHNHSGYPREPCGR
jgi:hypothetical protein